MWVDSYRKRSLTVAARCGCGRVSPGLNLRVKVPGAGGTASPTTQNNGYLPTTTIEKESGSMGARGPRPPFLVASGGGASAGGAGGGPYSAAISNTWLVFGSSVSVLAPRMVGTFCSTTKLVGLFSLMTVRVPSPFELKASMVLEIKVAPSVPVPIGRVSRILPVSELRITMVAGVWQEANRT